MATPARTMSSISDTLRSTLRRKLLKDSCTSLLDTVETVLVEMYPSLEISLNTVESSCNQLAHFITVSRKIKYYNECTGPLDTIKLVFDSKLSYTVYVFCDVFANEGLPSLQEVASLAWLKKMNDSSWAVCHGIDNYSSFKLYKLKDAVCVTLPSDSV